MRDCVAAQAGSAPALSPRPVPPRQPRMGASSPMWPVVLPNDKAAPGAVRVMDRGRIDWQMDGVQVPQLRGVDIYQINVRLTPIFSPICPVYSNTRFDLGAVGSRFRVGSQFGITALPKPAGAHPNWALTPILRGTRSVHPGLAMDRHQTLTNRLLDIAELNSTLTAICSAPVAVNATLHPTGVIGLSGAILAQCRRIGVRAQFGEVSVTNQAVSGRIGIRPQICYRRRPTTHRGQIPASMSARSAGPTRQITHQKPASSQNNSTLTPIVPIFCEVTA